MKESDIILATGGVMVKAAYSSGTPALGVGAGNASAIIDRSADIMNAVNSIIHSKTFDNGMICATEQTVIAHKDIYDAVKAEFAARGCYFLNSNEAHMIRNTMQAHCLDIKKRIPNAKTVFIGPCVAKKDEAEHYDGIVDAVLTFEELTNWLEAEKIELRQELKPNEESRARFFPTTGGVLKTMAQNEPGYTYIALDGIENCIVALREIESGNIHKCFIEMSACVGSCAGGPVMEKYHRSPVKDYLSVAAFAGEKDFAVEQLDLLSMKKQFVTIGQRSLNPTEEEIYGILRQMGKFKPEQELNCGSCGYNTCREKAIAIYQGKAEISMCLPFLKDKAESFSDTIVKNTPNALIVLNESLEVQQINSAALKIMNIRDASDVLGDQVIRILDTKVFMDVLKTGNSVNDQRIYLAEYKRYVEQTIVFDHESRMLVCMATIAKYIKKTTENAKIIFIGPCTAKKMEVQLDSVKPYVDAVLTFEELQALFDSRDIDITALEEGVLDNASYFGRIFARCGGLSESVAEGLKEQGFNDFELKAYSCDGIEECRIALLKKNKNVLDGNFIEGMACVGGCIGGAGCLTHGEKNKAEVDKYGREAFEKTISEAIAVLK